MKIYIARQHMQKNILKIKELKTNVIKFNNWNSIYFTPEIKWNTNKYNL